MIDNEESKNDGELLYNKKEGKIFNNSDSKKDSETDSETESNKDSEPKSEPKSETESEKYSEPKSETDSEKEDIENTYNLNLKFLEENKNKIKKLELENSKIIDRYLFILKNTLNYEASVIHYYGIYEEELKKKYESMLKYDEENIPINKKLTDVKNAIIELSNIIKEWYSTIAKNTFKEFDEYMDKKKISKNDFNDYIGKFKKHNYLFPQDSKYIDIFKKHYLLTDRIKGFHNIYQEKHKVGLFIEEEKKEKETFKKIYEDNIIQMEKYSEETMKEIKIIIEEIIKYLELKMKNLKEIVDTINLNKQLYVKALDLKYRYPNYQFNTSENVIIYDYKKGEKNERPQIVNDNQMKKIKIIWEKTESEIEFYSKNKFDSYEEIVKNLNNIIGNGGNGIDVLQKFIDEETHKKINDSNFESIAKREELFKQTKEPINEKIKSKMNDLGEKITGMSQGIGKEMGKKISDIIHSSKNKEQPKDQTELYKTQIPTKINPLRNNTQMPLEPILDPNEMTISGKKIRGGRKKNKTTKNKTTKNKRAVIKRNKTTKNKHASIKGKTKKTRKNSIMHKMAM
jgi:hypothetical protein